MFLFRAPAAVAILLLLAAPSATPDTPRVPFVSVGVTIQEAKGPEGVAEKGAAVVRRAAALSRRERKWRQEKC